MKYVAIYAGNGTYQFKTFKNADAAFDAPDVYHEVVKVIAANDSKASIRAIVDFRKIFCCDEKTFKKGEKERAFWKQQGPRTWLLYSRYWTLYARDGSV